MKFVFILISIYSVNLLASIKTIGGNIDFRDNLNGVIHLSISDGHYSSACTATKIAENFIITAAHCFYGINVFKMGFSNKSINADFEYKDLAFKKVIIHPEFAKLSQEEFDQVWATFEVPDIALVEIIPNDDFKKISIMPFDFEYVAPDKMIEFWGYGCQESINDLSSYVPMRKFAYSVVIGQKYLETGYGPYDEFYKGLAANSYRVNIFTKGRRLDPNLGSLCFGDSGGPLVLNNKIVGINSNYTFNDLEAEGSRSGVSYVNLHSRVSFVKKWIQNILKN